jgi:hypothetical protein
MTDHIALASEILEHLRGYAIPDRPFCSLHPYTLLKPLLTHAPSESGKENIAKDIIHNFKTDFTTTSLTRLADDWWTYFFNPRNILSSTRDK